MKFKNTFMVGLYKCEMTYSHGNLKAKWSPTMPPHRSLSKQEIEQYRTGRDDLMADVATAIGGSVMVVEASRDEAAGIANAVRAATGITTGVLESASA
jgi:hypothetical protein